MSALPKRTQKSFVNRFPGWERLLKDVRVRGGEVYEDQFLLLFR